MNQFNSANNMKEFSTEAKEKCARLMYFARNGVFTSRDLYKDLLLSGHLKDTQDYDDIVQDSGFMITLKDTLARSLETDPVKSLYGHGMISEFDLYWKCDTDLELVQHFKDKNITITGDQMVMLREARRDLKRLVTETRSSVVMNFGASGTPLTKQQSKKLLTKTNEQIELEIKNRAEKNLQSKRNDAKKRRVIDDEAVDNDAMDESIVSQVESISDTVPAKYASSRCK
jgi:hypothetical protein